MKTRTPSKIMNGSSFSVMRYWILWLARGCIITARKWQKVILTRMRSALVRNEQLGEFARQAGSWTRHAHGAWGSCFRRARPRQFARFHFRSCNWRTLSGLRGLPSVEKFMEPLLDSVRERVMLRSEIYDPKSRFQEWAQSEKLGTPRYVTVASSWSGPCQDV